MASSTPQPLSTVPAAARIVTTNEKVTGPAGLEMLRQSGILHLPEQSPSPSPGGLEILDIACGGGIITAQLISLAQHHPDSLKINRIIAADKDESMLTHTRSLSSSHHWSDIANIEITQMDQTSLPLPDATLDDVFNNFGIFFHPHDSQTLSETRRVLKPGGVAGFTSWKSIAWWSSVALPAFKKFIPDAPALPETVTVFPAQGWTEVDSVQQKLVTAGFGDVRVSEYAFTPVVEAEEFAEATGVLVKVVMKRLWKEEDFATFAGRVEGALLRYLRANYEGGRWDGEMVAIVATGKK